PRPAVPTRRSSDLDVTRPVPTAPRRGQGQGCGRERAPQGSLRRDADAPGGAADHRDGLVQVLSGPRVEVGMVPRRADWGVDVGLPEISLLPGASRRMRRTYKARGQHNE